MAALQDQIPALPADSQGNAAECAGRGGGGADDDDQEQPREQDRFLPVANIARIMKRVLPANEKISREAKDAVQECVSEFISFITSEASEKCKNEKRKTINGEDILSGMETLGFDDYVEPLTMYLQKYKAVTKGAKGAASSSSAESPQLPVESPPASVTSPSASASAPAFLPPNAFAGAMGPSGS
mmetsp:Transcript_48577/g.110264  ORF Transcript_48577/g.110264 Transcript_48577/m.110264 type:complete len:185 (+) Transcript_48577:55-609(+)